jgi:aminopeptidase YwaD
MRGVLAGLAFVMVLAAACSSGEPAGLVGEGAGNAPATIPAGVQAATGRASGPAEHDGARTFAHVQELAGRIGERVSGTPGEARAVEYIVGQFRESGYTVEVMPFEFEATAFKNSTVRVGGDDVAAIAMSGSKSGSVTGKAVYVPKADAASLEGKDVKGAVVISDRDGTNFGVKAEAALAAGAAAVVVINREPGLYPGSLAREVDVLVVGIAQESGERLREAAAKGERVSVGIPERTASVNVIARPSEGGDCRIIVGGHHDTVPGVPGATDNASGTATVLELARAFAADGLDEGLCWVTFGGEESGLHGSQALVERLKREGSLPDYMVNLDVTGTGTAVEVVGESELQRAAVRLAESLGIRAAASGEAPNSSSDHASFRLAGVRVLMLSSNDYSLIHRPEDTVENIDREILTQVGDLAFAAIGELLAEVARG